MSEPIKSWHTIAFEIYKGYMIGGYLNHNAIAKILQEIHEELERELLAPEIPDDLYTSCVDRVIARWKS